MSNPHVFISYSTQDYEFVKLLMQDLQAAGVEVWIDKHGLKAGTPDWENAIREAIRNAYAILLVASPDSRDSRYVRDELLIAEMYKRDVVAIWARGDKWPECVRMGYIGTQYADSRDKKYHDGVLETVNALRGFQSTPAIEEKASPKVVPPNFTPRNPYKGLRAFTSTDKGDFFGRGKLIEELVEALKENTDNNRFLAVVGPSGSGKSSVVMAGLLPCLQAGALPGSDKWIYLEPVLPGSQPLESLAVVLANGLTVTIGSVLDELDRSSRSLSLFAKQLAKGQRDGRVVILIDQFEELFTQTTDEDKRSHFIDLLVTAATELGGQTIVLLTLRADFYDRPMNYPERGKLLEKRTKSVLPMNVEYLRDVIEKPARLTDVQLHFEEGLVGDLLFEVRGQVGALPLLQFTLDQLVEKRSGDLLTNAAYKDIGGVKGALARHAESVYWNLSTDQHREMTKGMFLRLIELGASEQDVTKRRSVLSELSIPDPEKNQVQDEIVSAFTDSRLLTISVSGTISTIELSHEALIREWERLMTWIRLDRDDIRIQHKIIRDAQEWIHRGKPKDYLYRGIELQEATDWLEKVTPSNLERTFVSACVEQELLEDENQIFNPTSPLLVASRAIQKYVLRSRSQDLYDSIRDNVWSLFPIDTSEDNEFLLAEFYRDYTSLKLQRRSTPKHMYRFITNELAQLPLPGHTSPFIEDMGEYADIYIQIRSLDKGVPAPISETISNLELLRFPQPYPLLMNLYYDYGRNRSSTQTIDIILKIIESFVVRSEIIGANSVRTRDLLFVPRFIDDEHLFVRVIADRAGDLWPEDGTILETLTRKSIFHRSFHLAKLLLVEFEREANPDHVLPTDIDLLELRQIAPMKRRSYMFDAVNPNLNDTIGNFILVERHLNLPRSEEFSFEYFQTICNNSRLVSSMYFIGLEQWTDTEIAKRSAEIANRVVSIWPSASTILSMLGNV